MVTRLFNSARSTAALVENGAKCLNPLWTHAYHLLHPARTVQSCSPLFSPAILLQRGRIKLTHGYGRCSCHGRKLRTDTVVALGGVGVITRSNGLMTLSPEVRPALGIIPMGSGNDYARTLGMKINDPEGAFAQLVRRRQAARDWSHQRRLLHGDHVV